MLHRLARLFFKAGTVETWIIPQLEGGSDPTKGSLSFDFNASAGVQSGVLAMYLWGDRISINIAPGATPDEISDALADEINDNDYLPVTALSVAGVVTITTKSGGDYSV